MLSVNLIESRQKLPETGLGMPMRWGGGIMVAIIDVGTPSLTVGGVIPWLGIPHCIEGRGARAAAGIRSCFLIKEAVWPAASRSFPAITGAALRTESKNEPFS